MMIKNTVIFDMDGLMIDSETLTYRGYIEELARLGHTLELPFYQTVLGNPMRDIERKFKQRYGENFPFKDVASRVHRSMNDSFVEKGVPLKRGLLQLLAWLNGRQCAVGIATSSDRYRVDRILDLAGIAEYFDFVVCGDEVSRGKPDPEIFLACCSKSGCAPSEAVVLEDSEPGIQASFTAGIACIAVPDMKIPEPDFIGKAYRVVGNLEEALLVLSTNEDFAIPERKKVAPF